VSPWFAVVFLVFFLFFSWFVYWAFSRLCRIGFVKKDDMWIPDPQKYEKNNNGCWIRKNNRPQSINHRPISRFDKNDLASTFRTAKSVIG
jgi:hypothetical protein